MITSIRKVLSRFFPFSPLFLLFPNFSIYNLLILISSENQIQNLISWLSLYPSNFIPFTPHHQYHLINVFIIYLIPLVELSLFFSLILSSLYWSLNVFREKVEKGMTQSVLIRHLNFLNSFYFN